MKIKICNIAIDQSHLISIHLQQQRWGSLVYREKVWLEFSFFLRVTFFRFDQHFF